jgi:phosphoglycolate phosphatase-like HAD superfamily hydrolase
MALELSRHTDVPNEDIIQSMSRVFEHEKTTEFYRLIENLDCWGPWLARFADQKAELKKLTKIGNQAFGKQLETHQPAIEGVRETLEALLSKDIECFIVTNAPIDWAYARLKRAKLNHYFSLIRGIRSQVNNVITQNELGPEETTIDLDIIHKEKPNVDLSKILNISPEQVRNNVAFVGDSFRADMGLAHLNKCVGFHALYGRSDPAWAKLNQFVTPTLESNFALKEEEQQIIRKGASIFNLKRPTDLLDYLGL